MQHIKMYISFKPQSSCSAGLAGLASLAGLARLQVLQVSEQIYDSTRFCKRFDEFLECLQFLRALRVNKETRYIKIQGLNSERIYDSTSFCKRFNRFLEFLRALRVNRETRYIKIQRQDSYESSIQQAFANSLTNFWKTCKSCEPCESTDKHAILKSRDRTLSESTI